MNLYQINFNHIAQKGSRNGIYCYLVANNSEEVYEWLKEENRPNDGLDTLYVPFVDYEDDYEDYKQTLVDNNGMTGSGYESWDDLYYGQTHIDWMLKKENFDLKDYEIIKNNGVKISKVKEK